MRSCGEKGYALLNAERIVHISLVINTFEIFKIIFLFINTFEFLNFFFFRLTFVPSSVLVFKGAK